jgi:hypothetical protein
MSGLDEAQPSVPFGDPHAANGHTRTANTSLIIGSMKARPLLNTPTPRWRGLGVPLLLALVGLEVDMLAARDTHTP